MDHATWWTRFQDADDGERRSMLDEKRGSKRRRRRRRGRGAVRAEPAGQPAM